MKKKTKLSNLVSFCGVVRLDGGGVVATDEHSDDMRLESLARVSMVGVDDFLVLLCLGDCFFDLFLGEFFCSLFFVSFAILDDKVCSPFCDACQLFSILLLWFKLCHVEPECDFVCFSGFVVSETML